MNRTSDIKFGQCIKKKYKIKTKNNYKDDSYESLFKNINSSIAIYQVNSNETEVTIKDFNSFAEKLTGLKKKEIINKNIIEVFPNLKNSYFYDSLFRVYKTGVSEKTPFYYYSDDRVSMWKENYLFKISSNEVASVFNDVKETIELDEKLHNYRILYENTKDIILFIESNGNIIEANNSAIKSYGYDKKELLSKNIKDIRVTEDMHILHHQMKKAEKESIVFNAIHKRKDGSVFPVEVSSVGTKIKNRSILCSIIRDVSEREKAVVDLKQSEERYRLLFENANDLVYTRKLDGKIITANNACERMLGYSRDKFLKMNIYDIVDEEYHKYINNIVKENSEGSKVTSNLIIKFKQADSKAIFLELSQSVLYRNSELIEVQVIARDITERKMLEEEIKYLSLHDKLTGLYNRTFFEYEIHTLIDEDNFPLSIIMADVNGLKLVNDAFGHQEGDRLLKAISDILKQSVDNNSYIIRLGGDEFIVLSPKSSKTLVRDIIYKIKKVSTEDYNLPIRPSISLGYSIMDNATKNIDDIIKEAENMMYTNKLTESRSFRSSVIISLQETMYENTPESAAHCNRMKELAIIFGKSLGFTDEKINELSLLALLHDIGKITIPKSILEKPGNLTKDEWKVIVDHCKIGYNIANSIPDLRSIANLILSHHERWDGQGYPQGLKQNEIPLLSRIVAVLDAYDIMTNDSPYKKAITREEAILELNRGAGSQFDPEILEKFKNILRL